MSISLSKGSRIDLSKTSPNLRKAIIGLGWDTNKYSGGFEFDLDASAFLVSSDGKVKDERDFVFYNNLTNSNGSVKHTGDNRTGEGEGDDEQIIIDFDNVPASIDKIAITVTIFEAQQRAQNFGQVTNAFVRLVNAETNEEILIYNLGEDFSVETAVVFCEIYRYNGSWKFNAVGSGFQGGLKALCNNYGLDAD